MTSFEEGFAEKKLNYLLLITFLQINLFYFFRPRPLWKMFEYYFEKT